MIHRKQYGRAMGVLHFEMLPQCLFVRENGEKTIKNKENKGNRRENREMK